jgi:hypothetical protein
MTAQLVEDVCTDFTDFARQSEPHREWCDHRDLLRHISANDVGFRGCLGLGLLADNGHSAEWPARGSRVFIPDRDVTWLTMQDIPRGRWRSASDRNVQLACVRKTKMRFGLPTLGEPEHSFDFRRMPFSRFTRRGEVVQPGPDTLDSENHPQWFTVFNKINRTMSSTAFAYRLHWKRHRKLLDGTSAVLGRKTGVENGMFFDFITPPAAWMPKAFIGFHMAAKSKLFDQCTDNRGESLDRLYTDTFKDCVLADIDARMPVHAPIDGAIVEIKRMRDLVIPHLEVRFAGPKKTTGTVKVFTTFTASVLKGQEVKAGDVIGYDSPPRPRDWENMPPAYRWNHVLPEMFGHYMGQVLCLWFERQIIQLQPGYVHLPVHLALPAAAAGGCDQMLYWAADPSDALDYYDEAMDAFVFPTISLDSWDQFRLAPDGVTEFNLLPDRMQLLACDLVGY